MRDYWLSKLFFDLQQPALAAEFRADPDSVLSRYRLDERVKRAVIEHDAPFLAERTNAYLPVSYTHLTLPTICSV